MIRFAWLMVAVSMLLLTACGGDSQSDAQQGAQSLTGTGDEQADQWQFNLSDGALEDKNQITMTVLTNTQDLNMGESTLIGQPITLEMASQSNVRLSAPITLTAAIPDDYLDPAQAASLFIGYYTDNAWEYFLPTGLNYEDKTATFQAYHFSTYALIKASDRKKLDTYATLMATQKWQAEDRTNALKHAVNQNLNDMLAELGVKNNTARNQLIADAVAYLENETLETGGVSPLDALAQLSNSASKGDAGKQEFSNKLLEFTGKALASTLETIHNAPGDYVGKFANGVNVIGNLSSALGYVVEGDTRGAAEAIATMLKGTLPVVALVDATIVFVKNQIENSIQDWTKEEIEKAYQIYATGIGGKYGYEDDLQGDFNTIFTLLGGGDRQIDIRLIASHCKRLKKQESSLSTQERQDIIANAKKALKANFDKRIRDENNINALKVEETQFIEALVNEGLLGALDYKKYFREDKTYNVLGRLEKLYQARALVLANIDEDIAANLSHQDIARAIKQWIFWGERNERSSFLEYLKAMGYLREPVTLAQPTFAWRLVNVLQSDWQTRLDSQNASYNGIYEAGMTVSGNSAKFQFTYTGPDQGSSSWLKPGMTAVGEIAWSDPNQSVYLPEDAIELSVSVTHISSSFTYGGGNWMNVVQLYASDENGNQTGSAPYMSDKDGVDFFTSGAGNNFENYSGVKQGKMGTGYNEDSYKTIRVNASAGWGSVATSYIYQWRAE